VIAATAASLLQGRVAWSGSLLHAGWLPFGICCGVGALGGDALKSYFKRRRGIAPGEPWVPADQLDFVAGGLVAVLPFVPIGIADVAFILVFSFVADIVVNQLAYRLHIRLTPW
jgi:CDP-2,3-bis-(O-geranylgeranyl)-sn-glycerol synthase